MYPVFVSNVWNIWIIFPYLGIMSPLWSLSKTGSTRRLHRARRAEAVAGTKGHLLRGGFKRSSPAVEIGSISWLISYMYGYMSYMWSYGIIYVFDIWCKLMYYMCVTLWWSNIWKITIRITGKSSCLLSISIGLMGHGFHSKLLNNRRVYPIWSYIWLDMATYYIWLSTTRSVGGLIQKSVVYMCIYCIYIYIYILWVCYGMLMLCTTR